MFLSKLDIKLPSKLSSAGAKMNLTIKTSPNTYVGLLAVDKRVLFQEGASSNDLNMKRLLTEFMEFGKYWRAEPFKVSGQKSKFNDFGESNAFLLTGTEDNIKTRFLSEEDDDDDVFSDLFGTDRKEKNENQHKIRKEFPETWFYESFKVDESGEIVLKKTVPDTITSWVITGFSLDREKGLGLSEQQQLYVKQDFFIKVNLPYSIRYGEILKVEVLIFNYVKERKTNLSVNVTLSTDMLEPEFEFLEKTSRCDFNSSAVNESTKLVSVAQFSSALTFFYIKPLTVGKLKFCIKAVGLQVDVTDEIEREFRVEYDGITVFRNHPILIDVNNREFDSYNYLFSVSKGAIQESIRVGFSVIGDLMGPALVDVSKLM